MRLREFAEFRVVARLDELRYVARKTEPSLANSLANNSDFGKLYDERDILRSPMCGLATAALQLYLLEKHGIKTDRHRARFPAVVPRGLNQRTLDHVILTHRSPDGEVIIDPTYSQFYRFVGLTPRRASRDDRLRDQYPASSIAVFPSAEYHTFADEVAHRADNIRAVIRGYICDDERPLAPDDTLLHTSAEILDDVYRYIWSLSQYEPFPLSEQPNMSDEARRVADAMLNNLTDEN